jgi:hypothetical protein
VYRIGPDAADHDRVDVMVDIVCATVTSGAVGGQLMTPGCMTSATLARSNAGAR